MMILFDKTGCSNFVFIVWLTARRGFDSITESFLVQLETFCVVQNVAVRYFRNEESSLYFVKPCDVMFSYSPRPAGRRKSSGHFSKLLFYILANRHNPHKGALTSLCYSSAALLSTSYDFSACLYSGANVYSLIDRESYHLTGSQKQGCVIRHGVSAL